MQSQLINLPLPLEEYGFLPNHSDKQGDYRIQMLKGKLTGKGLFKSKEGFVYIGDFKEKVFNGKGILISTTGNGLPNCPENTAIFVGRFSDGRKNGKGICYDKDGNVIFSGKFVDDSPITAIESDTYPNRYFTDVKTDEFYYIGEFEADYPEGVGAVLYSNGDMMISDFKEGERNGISVFINNDGNWVCENVKGEEVKVVSSSLEYEETLQKAKENLDATVEAGKNYKTTLAALYPRKPESRLNNVMSKLSEIFMVAGNVLMTAGNIVENVQVMKGGAQIYGGDTSDGTSKGSSSKKKSSREGTSLSEQQSYNSDKSTYSKYDSMLAQVFAGNREASTSEIRQWQSKMKSLRQKWEAKGKSFPYSANESR